MVWFAGKYFFIEKNKGRYYLSLDETSTQIAIKNTEGIIDKIWSENGYCLIIIKRYKYILKLGETEAQEILEIISKIKGVWFRNEYCFIETEKVKFILKHGETTTKRVTGIEDSITNILFEEEKDYLSIQTDYKNFTLKFNETEAKQLNNDEPVSKRFNKNESNQSSN